MNKNKIIRSTICIILIIAIIVASCIIINKTKSNKDIITNPESSTSEIQTTTPPTTETTTSKEYANFDWDDMPDVNPNSLKDYEYSVTLEKENSIQVLGVGNSDLYSGYIPNIAWANYGFTNAIVAYANLTTPQAYAHLREVLEVQKPKIVFIEAAMMYEGINVGRGTVDTSRDTTELPAAETGFSLLQERTITHGYKFSTKSVKLIKTDYAIKSKEIDTPAEEYTDYMNKMITLCKIKGATPVLIYLPTMVYWNYARHNAIQQIANDNKIDFLDFNLCLDDANFDVTTNFRDAGNHLNYYGAVNCTNYLAKYLKDNYGLIDHRHIKEYKDWNENHKEYKKIVANV